MVPDRILARLPGRAQYEMAQHGATIRLGGDDPDTFVPEVCADKWGGECWLRVRHADAGLVPRGRKGKDVVHKGRRGVEIDCGRRTHRITEGSVKWEIVYTDASDFPPDRIVRFALDASPNLTWVHQPALTDAQIAEGCVRPENAVDSWAALWPQRGRYLDASGQEIVNYETGKFCHSSRWLWLASDGATCWVHHEIVPGEMWGDCPPQDWLDAHPGPYALDPEFGYTSAGASGSIVGGQIRAPKVTGAAGTVSKLTAYLNSGAAQPCVAGIYDTSGTSPNALQAQSSPVNVPNAAGWSDFALSFTSSAVSYWLAVNATSGYLMYDSGTTADKYAYNSSTAYNATMPSTFPTPTAGDSRLYSIFATHTAGGAIWPWWLQEGCGIGDPWEYQ